MTKVSFRNQSSPFFTALRGRVDGYFKSNGIAPTAPPAYLFQGILHIVLGVALYFWLVFFTPVVWLAVPACILFGFNLAFTGFNLMHGASHGCYSKHKWLNRLGAYSLNVMGGNAYFWHQKHNINHHTYTNVVDVDSDIDPKPFLRMHAGQKHYAAHRFQHWYFLFVYALSYISWIFIDDSRKYFSGHIAHYVKPMTARREHLIFWFTKLYYVTVYLAIPIAMLGWGPALLGYVIAGLACGVMLATVFQLAHVMDEADFMTLADDKVVNREWAVHQIMTTVNFSTRSKFWSLLLGGLNFQVEHHLFPRIHHAHYPAISELVRQTCADFNVPYLEHKTIWQAIAAHRAYLKVMGVRPETEATTEPVVEPQPVPLLPQVQPA